MSAGLHGCTEPQRTVHLPADPLINEIVFVVRDLDNDGKLLWIPD